MASGEVKQNYELAYEDYRAGMKYKEIADKYGVTVNTVKSWKTRYKWCKDGKKVCIQKPKKCAYKKAQKENPGEAGIEEVEQVIENPDLTDKQRLFCIYYVRCFNATKAYQKAYECGYEAAMVNGSRMLRNDKVKEEILRLKREHLNREFLSGHDIFQKYMDIAFSDITDYVKFGTEEVPVMAMYGPVQVTDEETGEKKTLTKLVNTVYFKDSADMDGTLISEVKQGRDGASIKLLDKMKALNWLAEHMNMATEEQRARIEQIKANTERMKAGGGEEEEGGVTIINDAPTGEDIGYRDTEVSEDIQQ